MKFLYVLLFLSSNFLYSQMNTEDKNTEQLSEAEQIELIKEKLPVQYQNRAMIQQAILNTEIEEKDITPLGPVRNEFEKRFIAKIAEETKNMKFESFQVTANQQKEYLVEYLETQKKHWETVVTEKDQKIKENIDLTVTTLELLKTCLTDEVGQTKINKLEDVFDLPVITTPTMKTV